jgi:hypothetical protein
MRCNVLPAIAAAFVLGLALAVQAEPVRLPRAGDPAFAFDAPAGWRIVYDQRANLQFFHASNSVVMQLTMVGGPDAKQPLEDGVALAFRAAGFPPFTRQQAGVIDGRAGQIFFGSKDQNGVQLLVDLTAVRLDATHVAVLWRLRRADAEPGAMAALDALVAAVRLTGVQ